MKAYSIGMVRRARERAVIVAAAIATCPGRPAPVAYRALIRGVVWLLAVQATALAIDATHASAAVTAQVTANQLVVTGNAASNQITVRVAPLDPTKIQVSNGGTSLGLFGSASFFTILVDAAGGDDAILLDSGSGFISKVSMLVGGPGNDFHRRRREQRSDHLECRMRLKFEIDRGSGGQ